MKRSFALVLSIIMVLTMMLSFTSCSNDTMVNGYYVVTNVTIDGVSYPSGTDLDELKGNSEGIDNLYVKIMGNGEGELCAGKTLSPLTYDDKQMTVNGKSMSYTYAENIITLNDYDCVIKDSKGENANKTEVKAVVELKYAVDENGKK